jgi:hypothetical protein
MNKIKTNPGIMKNEPFKISRIIVLMLIIFLLPTCKKDDSSDLAIKKGMWSGTDISFKVGGSPLKITDLEFTYRGHVSNGGCSFDYESTESYNYFTTLESMGFVGDTNIFNITGTFTSDTIAELTIGWENYDSMCEVGYSGSMDYTVKYNASGK